MKHEPISLPQIEDAARAFAALGSPQRLTILRRLVRAGPGGLPMGAIADATGIAGPTLTHHLRALTGAGLVIQTRAGRQIIAAAVAHDRVAALSAYLLENCCADAADPAQPNPKDPAHG